MFQKQIEQKFINRINNELIEEKYKLFKESFQNPEKIAHIKDSKEEQYQEGFLRDVFCKVLGYTINPEPNFNLITEKKNDSDSRKADGAIILNSNVKAVIELKGCDTTDLSKIENQAFGYKAHNPGCRYVIISNFEKLRFYIDDASDFLEFRLFSLSKEDFKLFYTCLALNQIENDIPSLMKIESLSEENSITNRFYEDYSRFKKELFKDICENNLSGESLPLAANANAFFATLSSGAENVSSKSAPQRPEKSDDLRHSELVSESTNEMLNQVQHDNKNAHSSFLNSRLLLFKKTQKLLDRILFILFCEDRGLLPENSVLTIINQWKKLKDLDAYQPLYNRFKNYFDHINTGYKSESDPSYVIFAYNGGLFKPDEILDKIKISDDVLLKNATILSNYDFESQVSVDILGHIFEHSLSELDDIRNEELGARSEELGTSNKVVEALETTVQHDKTAFNDKSKSISKRKKDGVFYTPSYITKYIVQNTVGELCRIKKLELGINDEDYAKRNNKNQKAILAKKLEDYRNYLLSLKILDPACGSGAFLNATLQFLKDEHSYIDELNAKLYGDTIVFPGIENAILENNIFGVDINDESVEIAKLSLWLHTAQKGRKLSTLTNNIKCGNSLIDDANVAGEKAFNWEKEFPFLDSKGGFDVVIGNPPYVSAPMQVENADLARNRQGIIDSKKYKTLYQKWDLYIPFIELGTKILLKENGFCSMIVPYPMTNQLYAKKCREMLLNDYNLSELVDLKDTKIFADATVQSCIFVAQKTKSKNSIKISKIKNSQINVVCTKKREDFLQDETTFVWNTENIERKASRHADMHVLGDFCYISKGMVLNSDENKAKGEFKKEDLISDTKDEIHCRKFIEGKDCSRYVVNRVRYLEYNTERVPNKLSRPTFPELYTTKKLMFNRLGELQVYLDKDGDFTTSDAMFVCLTWNSLKGVNNKSIENSIKKFSTLTREKMESLSEKIDLRCLLAILNSKYAKVLLSNIRGGDYHIYPEHIRKIPIPNSSLLNPNSSILTSLSDKMLSLNSERQIKLEKFLHRINETYGAKKSALLEEFYNHNFAEIDKEFAKQKIHLSLKQKDELEEYFNSYKTELSSINEQISATDKQIDSEVYKLYGLSAEEIAVVENSSK